MINVSRMEKLFIDKTEAAVVCNRELDFLENNALGELKDFTIKAMDVASALIALEEAVEKGWESGLFEDESFRESAEWESVIRLLWSTDFSLRMQIHNTKWDRYWRRRSLYSLKNKRFEPRKRWLLFREPGDPARREEPSLDQCKA